MEQIAFQTFVCWKRAVVREAGDRFLCSPHVGVRRGSSKRVRAGWCLLVGEDTRTNFNWLFAKVNEVKITKTDNFKKLQKTPRVSKEFRKEFKSLSLRVRTRAIR